MKADRTHADGERQRAEALDKQVPIDTRTFEGERLTHDGAELLTVNGRHMERRDTPHAVAAKYAQTR